MRQLRAHICLLAAAGLILPVTAQALTGEITKLGRVSVGEVLPGARPGALPSSYQLDMWKQEETAILVGLDPRSAWTAEDAHAIFGALERSRRELPALYQTLFELSRQGSKAGLPNPLPREKAAGWTNRNAVAAVVIVSASFGDVNLGRAMASNFYWLGKPQDAIYTNVPFLALDPDVIGGAIPGLGPMAIYPGRAPEEARRVYMSEGLIDSLLHERVHAYISQYYGHDALYAALRPSVPQPRCEYDLEELLVVDFLLSEYRQTALFASGYLRYWDGQQKLLRQRVKGQQCYARLRGRNLLKGPLLRNERPNAAAAGPTVETWLPSNQRLQLTPNSWFESVRGAVLAARAVSQR